MKIVKESRFNNGDRVRIVRDALVSKADTGEVLSVAYENDRFIYRVKFDGGYECKCVEEDWIEPIDVYPFELGEIYNICFTGDYEFDFDLPLVFKSKNYGDKDFKDEYTFEDNKVKVILKIKEY